MKSSSDHFVNTSQHEDEELISENVNEIKNDEEDPLQSVGICVSEMQYYKLDQVVFAEPIGEVETANNPKEPDHEDVRELTFIDSIVIKKRVGRRNKYMIDIREGCPCPMSACTQRFSKAALLRAHVRKVHCATARCVCEECGAAFAAPYLLRRHSAVHGGTRVRCAACGKWLSQRTSLSSHLRTHTAARPHACASCDKSFLRRASLSRHVKFVHKNGDLSCDSCDERFATRVQWTRHQATHKR